MNNNCAYLLCLRPCAVTNLGIIVSGYCWVHLFELGRLSERKKWDGVGWRSWG